MNIIFTALIIFIAIKVILFVIKIAMGITFEIVKTLIGVLAIASLLWVVNIFVPLI